MGFGPSGPRILPAVPQQDQGLAQFASGIESILTKAKESRDFTQGTETFEALLKKRTGPEGEVDFGGLQLDIASSRDITAPHKQGFQSVAQAGQQRVVAEREGKAKAALEKRKLDIEQQKADAASAKLIKEEKPPSDVTKFLERTNDAGTKAQVGIGLIDQIDEVLATGSGGLFGLIPLAHPVTGAIQEFTGLKSGDQRLMENLSFQLVTNAFPTLPRIKTEFDKLLQSNPSIVNTKSGNEKLTAAIRKSFNLAIDKQNALIELREQGVPEAQLEREINRKFAEKERIFEKQTLADFRNLKDSSELDSIDQILRDRGEL